MSVTDLVLIGVLLLALLAGWHYGTIRVLAGLGAVVVAYQLARAYSGLWAAEITSLLPQLDPGSKEGQMAVLFSLFVDTDTLANRLVQIILFIVIFVVVRWLIRKLAYLLTSIFGRGLLGAINRAVGAFLSGVLAIALLVIVHSIVLPAAAGMGLSFGVTALKFLNQSEWLLPVLYSVPQLLSV